MNWTTILENIRPQVIQLVLAVLGGYLLHRLTTKSADLICYMSHVQSVTLPPQGATPAVIVNTFVLFLWNQGKAPAKDVQVLHNMFPAHNVYPDIQRSTVPTPGGGTAIQFPSIPPKLLVNISYVTFNVPANQQIISHVTYEHGQAHFIPVNLQRVFPKWATLLFGVLMLVGMYAVIGWLLELLVFMKHHL